MKTKQILAVTLVLFTCAGNALSQKKITAEKFGDRIEIRINRSKMTNYILSEYEKYPFFFPVNGH